MKFIALLGKAVSAFILTTIFFTAIGASALAKRTSARIRSLFSHHAPETGFWMDKEMRPATLKELRRKY